MAGDEKSLTDTEHRPWELDSMDRLIVEKTLHYPEATLDFLKDSELLKTMPVLGWVVAFMLDKSRIHDRILASMIKGFLESLASVGPTLKKRIVKIVCERQCDARRVGNTILILLAKASDTRKATILAYIFVAYVYGNITEADFRRFADAIDQTFVDDLCRLLEDSELPSQSDSDLMRYLSRSGITQPLGGNTIDEIGEIHYEVADLGRRLVEAYRYGTSQRTQSSTP